MGLQPPSELLNLRLYWWTGVNGPGPAGPMTSGIRPYARCQNFAGRDQDDVGAVDWSDEAS